MNRLFILGAGGHTKQVIDIFKQNRYNIAGYFDDFKPKNDIYYGGYRIIDKISNAKNYLEKNDLLFCGIGDNNIRKKIVNNFSEFKFANCISRNTVISDTAKIGVGNYIGHYSNIMPDVSIGNFNIINDGSLIGHDVCIGDNNLIAIYVSCGAFTKIGNENLLGFGTVVNPTRITIGDNNIIGSGTVITKNIGNDCTVVGVPGKVIKTQSNK
jgi:sugar O-acyltransferase (sialic acid O-acetyltransferase NeuD family)